MEILLAFVIFAVFFVAMALGLLLQGKPLKGSCGGVAAMMGDKQCSFCGGDPNKCEELQQGEQTDLAYDASRQDKKPD